jgi:tRNA threonylcarbamoyladenosine biosynthesis protein TsaB
MGLILNIDTAIDKAYVSIAKDGIVLQEMMQDSPKDHAAFLQPAIQTIVKKAGIALRDLSAIAVADGPGSYTGLRVGMASAKGLCYALDKPMITVGSLQILARQAIRQMGNPTGIAGYLFCPMIDARRMEVYTAIFTAQEKMVEGPAAVVLYKNWLATVRSQNKIVFCGNGAHKWKEIAEDREATFLILQNNTLAMSTLSYQKFCNKNFANIIYAEPFYLKDFFTTAPL